MKYKTKELINTEHNKHLNAYMIGHIVSMENKYKKV